MGLQEKNKKFGPKRVINATKNSLSGLISAYKSEPSLMILLVTSICTVILGFVFKIELFEWLFIIISLACCVGAELINTAIENVVDLVTREIHPLAKVAKDTASAAEFIFRNDECLHSSNYIYQR